MKAVAASPMVIECCVTSNVKRIGGIYTNHPIRQMLAAGCKCTMNTDNRFLGRTTSTEEMLHCIDDVGMSWADVKEMLLIGAQSSFYWLFAAESRVEQEQLRDAWVAGFETEIDEVLSRSARL